jgi:hypothetical protein
MQHRKIPNGLIQRDVEPKNTPSMIIASKVVSPLSSGLPPKPTAQQIKKTIHA